MEHRAWSTGHGAQGTGHRAEGIGHRVWSTAESEEGERGRVGELAGA